MHAQSEAHHAENPISTNAAAINAINAPLMHTRALL
jgi:hypothetical protein